MHAALTNSACKAMSAAMAAFKTSVGGRIAADQLGLNIALQGLVHGSIQLGDYVGGGVGGRQQPLQNW
jgi:hypothetical protein